MILPKCSADVAFRDKIIIMNERKEDVVVNKMQHLCSVTYNVLALSTSKTPPKKPLQATLHDGFVPFQRVQLWSENSQSVIKFLYFSPKFAARLA